MIPCLLLLESGEVNTFSCFRCLLLKTKPSLTLAQQMVTEPSCPALTVRGLRMDVDFPTRFIPAWGHETVWKNPAGLRCRLCSHNQRPRGTGGLDGPGFVRGERNLLPDATPDFTAWQPLFCVPLKWFHDGLQQVCEKQAVLSQAALRYPGLVEPLGPGASGMLRDALAKQTPALHPKTAVLGLWGDGFCFITPLQSWHRYLG